MERAVRPRYASTVVLLRPDEKDNVEVLLTRRPRAMRFMGGFYVFPGGTVHPGDYAGQVLARCRGVSPDQARGTLGDGLSPEVSLGHWVAAVRELFEEVGVLLCETESGAALDVSARETRERLERRRREVVEKQREFGAFLEAESLYCDLAPLVYCYHRVTPDLYPIRFDTRFYLAALPLHQVPLQRSEEVAESLWLKPGEALERVYHQRFPLLPPTSTVLEDLAQVPTWRGLQARYHLKSVHG